MKNVLILNDCYMPLNVVAIKKACKMIVKSSIFESIGRKSEYHVDIMEYFDEPLKAGSKSIPRPAVIRIAHYKHTSAKKLKMHAPFSRNGVWRRDNECCQYCGKRVKLKDMHWDHVIPRKDGGKTIWTNIVCACFECNAKKADLPLSKCSLKLIKKPEPVYNEITPALIARERIVRKVGKEIPSQWKTYLEWIGIKE